MKPNRKGTVIWMTLLTFIFLYIGCQNEVGAGPPAPDFSLKDINGHRVTLGEHLGQVVLVDFWATWCPPCRKSIPELVMLQKEHKKKGLVILGISLDDPMQTSNLSLQAFIKDNHINYPILRSNQKTLKDFFGNTRISIPTMFIIDRQGKIKDKLVGFRPGSLENKLKTLL